MAFVYQKLPENYQRLARTSFPRKTRAVARRAALRAIRSYLGRWRWLTSRHCKKITWAGLWIRVRKAVGLVGAREQTASYDCVSYARNFDDGMWKEDEEFMRGGSFAYRFGYSGKFVG